jgi:hypothetical protein
MHRDGRTDETEAPNRSGVTLIDGADRRCRNCDAVALVFDVDANSPRCRSCGSLEDGRAAAR